MEKCLQIWSYDCNQGLGERPCLAQSHTTLMNVPLHTVTERCQKLLKAVASMVKGEFWFFFFFLSEWILQEKRKGRYGEEEKRRMRGTDWFVKAYSCPQAKIHNCAAVRLAVIALSHTVADMSAHMHGWPRAHSSTAHIHKLLPSHTCR